VKQTKKFFFGLKKCKILKKGDRKENNKLRIITSSLQLLKKNITALLFNKRGIPETQYILDCDWSIIIIRMVLS